MDNKYEPCSICELYICGYECHNDKCPVAKMKAEIERLKLENKKLHETNNTLNYQVDVWSPNETIKTFAEKMKGIIPEIDDTYIECIVEDYIEKTVKELTESNRGS